MDIKISGLVTQSLSPPTSSAFSEGSLEQRLATATVRWIKEINDLEKRSPEAVKEDNKCIRTGIWYPANHRKAIDSLGDKAVLVKDFLVKRDAYVCGFVDAKFFTHIRDDGDRSFKGKRIMHFIIKDGVLPSDAIKAAKIGLSLIDCGVACQIARYGALLEVLGTRKFNILFGNSARGQKMNIGYLVDDDLQPMQYFVGPSEATLESLIRIQANKEPEKFRSEIGRRPVKVGDLVEIKGVSSHRCKRPWSFDAGHNLFCSDATPGQQRFISLETEGTEAEINAKLVNGYKKDLELGDIVPELWNNIDKKLIDKYKTHKVEYLDPKKGEGFNIHSMQDFNVSLIQDLINLPEDEISMDYVRKNASQRADVLAQKIYSKIAGEK